MKKFNRVVTLIALFCLALGCLCMVVGGVKGGFHNMREMNFKLPFANIHYSFGSDKDDEFDMSIKEFEIKDGEEASFALADVKNLNLEVGGCQMRIEKSEDDKIHVKNTDNLKVAAKVSGDTLKIQSELKQNISSNKKLIISIPENAKFDDIDVDLGAIEMIAEVPFTCEKFSLDAGAGSINMKEIKADSLTINAGAGDISIAQGFVKDANWNMGMGNIDFSGDISGDFDLDMSMGSVNIELDSSEKEHNYEIDCVGGSVTVGSYNYDGIGGGKSINNGADSDYDIDCSMGSVYINFADKL